MGLFDATRSDFSTIAVNISNPVTNIDAFLKSFPELWTCCTNGGVHKVKNYFSQIQDHGMYLQAHCKAFTNIGAFQFIWRFNALEKEVKQEIETVFPSIIGDVIFDMVNAYRSDEVFV